MQGRERDPHSHRDLAWGAEVGWEEGDPDAAEDQHDVRILASWKVSGGFCARKAMVGCPGPRSPGSPGHSDGGWLSPEHVRRLDPG